MFAVLLPDVADRSQYIAEVPEPSVLGLTLVALLFIFVVITMMQKIDDD